MSKSRLLLKKLMNNWNCQDFFRNNEKKRVWGQERRFYKAFAVSCSSTSYAFNGLVSIGLGASINFGISSSEISPEYSGMS